MTPKSVHSAITWISIIDATRTELIELAARLELDPTAGARLLYCQALQAYLDGDIMRLARLVAQWQSRLERTPADQAVAALLQLRLAIRERAEPATLAVALQKVEAAGSDFWPEFAGEAAFVCAMAYETLDQPKQAAPAYRRAAIYLREVGAHKKSVKAELNAVVADSRIDPDRKLLAEYDQVYRRAKAVGQRGVAGVALLNVSREMQILGAHKAALRMCNRAIALLRADVGTLPYYLALLHRGHLLLDLGRATEAELDLETLRLSRHAEVCEGLKALRALHPPGGSDKTLPINEARLTPTWRARLRTASAPVLGELEERLFSLLSEGPKDRFELIAQLYGDSLGFEVLENRFKVLLNRIRKKRPGEIVLESGKYRLVDEAVRAPSPKAG